MEHLSNDHKDHPNQHKNSHKLAMKQGIPLWIWIKWDNNIIRISLWTKSHCRTNTSIRINRQMQKTRTVRSIVCDPRRKVNHLSKVIWDRKIIAEFTMSITSTRIGKPILITDIKVSKDKNNNRWIDQEYLIYVRRNRIKNRVQRQRKWSIGEKEVGHWVK